MTLAEEGVRSGDIAERLGLSPQQVYDQLSYMRKSLRENTPGPASEPEQPSVEPVNLEDKLPRELRIDDAVFSLHGMFDHLKNLFSMVREFVALDNYTDTLAASGENLCDTYINKLDEIIGQII